MPNTITDADFAVLKQRVDAQDLRQDRLESKLEKEIEGLKAELKESNKKLDDIVELLNQAKGAATATKVIYAVASAVIAGLAYVGAKGLLH